jgi:sodium/potassium-transporting ATPase subunit alpha
MDDDSPPHGNAPETDSPSPASVPEADSPPSASAGAARKQADGGGDQRIQFAPVVKPDYKRHVGHDRDGDSIAHGRQSIASIPQVISEEKNRHKREKEEEKKHVNIDEHLMPHMEVAERYKTRINLETPAESLGLTSQQAEQFLQEYGLNQLTPPKKRHPFFKYLDCLSSLFNLLLILAGILEYILLGINYKDNFQNVSVRIRPGTVG